eukprot:GHVU01128515.1.p1 GENE.GHVU01128515.1~~GHVU01128515.1.p1  ORF type:complete len:106 (+),score=10.81 GHVU01128515.1:282-599(+)
MVAVRHSFIDSFVQLCTNPSICLCPFIHLQRRPKDVFQNQLNVELSEAGLFAKIRSLIVITREPVGLEDTLWDTAFAGDAASELMRVRGRGRERGRERLRKRVKL